MSSLYEYSSSLKKKTKWHGDHNHNDHRMNLHAGLLSVFYENGSLRYISMGNNELIRMIYSAVRDKEWLTIYPEISGEEFEQHSDSFRIRYNCKYKSDEINFSARYLIEGHSDNSLIFSFEGEAINTFEKSRIGFCVLHPVEGCSGNPCNITHSDGNSETLAFPVYISPDQPFTDIKSMKWKVDGSECTLIFSGDVFETEDQRNWTDNSYKTYCTPQSLPCPATISKGQKISQRIELKVEPGVVNTIGDKDEIRISVSPEKSFDMPHIGIGRSTRSVALTENEIGVLKNINFDHYRVDLYLFSTVWREEADKAADEAVKLNYPLELALFFDENSIRQSDDFITWVTDRKPVVSLISLFHKTESVTSDRLTDSVAPRLKQVLPQVMIVCGTNANFAQLNGNFPSSGFIDQICYSVHPQEHASDNSTLVENLQAQAYSVESAMQFAEGRGIWISPVNLQRRFNANVENYETPVSGNTFPPQADNRLMSLFAACWTAGSVKYLCEAGASGMTFFETAGERGIIQGDFDSRWPEQFKTVKGMIFPVCFVFQYLFKYKSFKVLKSNSSHPLYVDCLILADGKKVCMIISNFSSEKQKVIVEGLTGEFTFSQLNAESFAGSVSDIKWLENRQTMNISHNRKIILEPFSVSFIDGDFYLYK